MDQISFQLCAILHDGPMVEYYNLNEDVLYNRCKFVYFSPSDKRISFQRERELACYLDGLWKSLIWHVNLCERNLIRWQNLDPLLQTFRMMYLLFPEIWKWKDKIIFCIFFFKFSSALATILVNFETLQIEVNKINVNMHGIYII